MTSMSLQSMERQRQEPATRLDSSETTFKSVNLALLLSSGNTSVLQARRGLNKN